MNHKYNLLLLSCTVINESTQVATFAVQDADYRNDMTPKDSYTVRVQTIIDGRNHDGLIVRQYLTKAQVGKVIYAHTIDDSYETDKDVRFLVESFILNNR